MSASTFSSTSPPRPPLPPSGPPSGLNFSRWMEEQPCPPSPAARCSTTRSTKVVTASPFASYVALLVGQVVLVMLDVLGNGGRETAKGTTVSDRGPLVKLLRCAQPALATASSAGTTLTTRRPRRLPNSTAPATSAKR